MGLWMQTYRGIKFDFDNLSPNMIDIDDIAHHLSITNRFNGATTQPYSVAQHCLEMSYIIPRLEVLLHDAHEAYIGDIITPVKSYLDQEPELGWLIHEIDLIIRIKFSLQPFDEVEGLAECDLRMCLTERNHLMGRPPEDWGIPHTPYNIQIVPRPWWNVKQWFLARFHELGGKA